MSTLDRLIRLFIALILFGLAAWKSSLLLLVFGIFMLLEALFSWCIVHQILRLHNCKKSCYDL